MTANRTPALMSGPAATTALASAISRNPSLKLVPRLSETRGKADHGWLKSFFSFSFANYYDPKFSAFGPLRVINEDRVTPGQGFGAHTHAEFEIFSVGRLFSPSCPYSPPDANPDLSLLTSARSGSSAASSRTATAWATRRS